MDIQQFLDEWQSTDTHILVHTSGSTGKPKPLLAEKCRMEASARMTCSYLKLNEGDSALLCMPLDFIAGKMMVVRSLTCGLRLFGVEPSAHPLAVGNDYKSLVPRKDMAVPAQFDFIAMTPMQVYATIERDDECDRLRRCRHLLIGGGSVSEQIEKKLKDFPNHVWSSYGMTETLSHIALRRVNGNEASDWYQPLGNVIVGTTADGCLWIEAPHIVDGRIETNDIVEMHADGCRFRVIGRKDNVICSGGIKIQAEEVERLLAESISVPHIVTKRSDEKYGETAVLLYEKGHQTKAEIEAICRKILPRYWQPKAFIETESIPLTPTGKPNRAAAYSMVNTR